MNIMTPKDLCYARGCDNNNVDLTCMRGDTAKQNCQVNCNNCVRRCKKLKGDMACKMFKRRIKKC